MYDSVAIVDFTLAVGVIKLCQQAKKPGIMRRAVISICFVISVPLQIVV